MDAAAEPDTGSAHSTPSININHLDSRKSDISFEDKLNQLSFENHFIPKDQFSLAHSNQDASSTVIQG
jgi:hypothetical protein